MRCFAAILILWCSLASGADPIITTGPVRITIEDVAAETGRPLPVVGCWNTGENQQTEGQDIGYAPDWQLEQIDAGTPWVPTFELFWSFSPTIRQQKPVYFEPCWSACRDRKLPIAFSGQNYADVFRTHLFATFDPAQPHPFLVKADGTVVKVASPYAPKYHCYALGRFFGEHLAVAFADDYPDPPSVLLLDNNEAGWASINEARGDVRCPAIITNAYANLSIQEARQVERYEYGKRLAALGAEFKRGLLDALPDGWKQAVRWIAYRGFGNGFCETKYTEDNLRYMVPWAEVEGDGLFQLHDGRTANVGYIHNWSTHDPAKVRSIQMEAGNVRYAIDTYHRTVNPEFFVESHYWNGKEIPAEQYLGCVRCVLWQTQTEYHRAFCASSQTRAATLEKHVQPLMTAVSEVHQNETLKRFWQHGKLLRNLWTRDWSVMPKANQYDTDTGYGHPYQSMMPPEYNNPGERLYLQHVPINERLVRWDTIGGQDARMIDRLVNDRTHQTPIRVFAIALELDGEYLIYAHAPGGDEQAVEIQVCPDGFVPRFSVTVDVPVAGCFCARLQDGTVDMVQ